MDLLGRMIAYEDGNLAYEDVVELFQELVDSGVIYSLQGSYGRTAQQLINAAVVFQPVGAQHSAANEQSRV